MGIDYNVVAGRVTDQLSGNAELKWLRVDFVQRIGRGLDRELQAFFDRSDAQAKPEVFFYAPFARSEEEVKETPYGRPSSRIDIDRFMEITEGTGDMRLVGLRGMINAYMGMQSYYPDFAVFLYMT